MFRPRLVAALPGRARLLRLLLFPLPQGRLRRYRATRPRPDRALPRVREKPGARTPFPEGAFPRKQVPGRLRLRTRSHASRPPSQARFPRTRFRERRPRRAFPEFPNPAAPAPADFWPRAKALLRRTRRHWLLAADMKQDLPRPAPRPFAPSAGIVR